MKQLFLSKISRAQSTSTFFLQTLRKTSNEIIFIKQQKIFYGPFHQLCLIAYFTGLKASVLKSFTLLSHPQIMKTTQHQGYIYLSNHHEQINTILLRKIVDIEDQYPHCMEGRGCVKLTLASPQPECSFVDAVNQVCSQCISVVQYHSG